MKSNYKRLGDYIRQIDERNKNLISIDLQGINIDKFFMPSVANIIGTDLENYKLIKKNQFACNPMHVGRDERLPIALYLKEKPAIVSPAYFVFEIIDNKLLSEYLMMWFRRSEFDRECWFYTDNSVRGGITWDAINELELPILSLDEQQKIVDAYNVIENCIALKRKENDNLEAQALTVFRKNCSANTDIFDKAIVLGDICCILKGKNPDILSEQPFYGAVPYLNINALSFGQPLYTAVEKMIIASRLDILMVMDGASSGRTFYGGYGAVASTLAKIEVVNDVLREFVWILLRISAAEMASHNTGSAIPHADKRFISRLTFHLPENYNILSAFFRNVREEVITNNSEISKLLEAQRTSLTSLSNNR